MAHGKGGGFRGTGGHEGGNAASSTGSFGSTICGKRGAARRRGTVSREQGSTGARCLRVLAGLVLVRKQREVWFFFLKKKEHAVRIEEARLEAQAEGRV
jgi:hypothetical protein